MALLPRRFLFGVCAVVLVIGLANSVHGEAAPVVVGLARCSDCTRKNMNTEAAFKGLQAAVKCKNGEGEYESKAAGHVDNSGAFSVPLNVGLVGDDGELKQDCFAQLHSASGAPCPGQEPSKIIAARPGRDGQTTFVALAGEVHRPLAECASAFLCHPLHNHHLAVFHKPVIVRPKPDHYHDHDHDHGHDHDHDHHHDQDLPPAVNKPPTTPVYTPTMPTPTPIYHPTAQRDAVTEPQLFKKMLLFLKKLPFFPPAKQSGKP
ncbi:hypothetical protein CFC21_058240 [Triticum aestivum]|uniref:Proline-rich protein n=3 Tax=Triticum TaxID=4564 RepID=A0A9R0WDK3_TRITD|nr:proline-rich protein 4-like [Triticum aestivum]KAF7049754.1 hypothetical protein CFC21_058240 [Triticum aestivum]VAI07777.1 unnamed protein product [Triticum turgidum subsp. durum]